MSSQHLAGTGAFRSRPTIGVLVSAVKESHARTSRDVSPGSPWSACRGGAAETVASWIDRRAPCSSVLIVANDQREAKPPAVELLSRVGWAVGWACVAAGAVLIVLAYLGASRQSIVAKQIPYLVSGGLGGLAFVSVGGPRCSSPSGRPRTPPPSNAS